MKKIIALFSTQGRNPSICDACKKEFVCGATIFGCWCTRIKLAAETRAKLRNQFQGCLCQNCLQYFQTEEQVNLNQKSIS